MKDPWFGRLRCRGIETTSRAGTADGRAPRRTSRWLSVSMLCMAMSVLGASAFAGVANAEGQFTSLQSGFTQELYGTGSGFYGGVAFARNADVWVDFCEFGNSALDRFDNSTTTLVDGSNVHPLLAGSPFASNAGCGLTNNPDGFLYSNTSSGVVQIDASTGAPTGVMFGEGGDALGITTDPQTGNLVYVGSDGTILTAPPGGASSTFSTATSGSFIDGIAFDPTGNFLFVSNRTLNVVTIIARSGALVQNSETISGVPDGISFHALSPKFVVTNNNDGSMTRLDFPENNYTKPPVNSVFASGGFRGDLTQVGPDGCLYLTQDETRFDDGTVTGNSSIVRVCPGFEPPPGVESELVLTPKSAVDPAGGEHTVTATVTEETTKNPVVGAVVGFAVTGQNAGVKGTCTTTKGAADPTCETDETGAVRFTYKDENGAGEDTINATVTVNGSTEHATASKDWIEERATGPVLDSTASAQHYRQATAKLTTKGSGDLIVAFVAADAPFGGGQTSTVSGGGLTWKLVGRENGALGDAEIWVARATGVLTKDPITATVNELLPGSPVGSGYDETITTVAFKKATGLGSVAKFSSKKGAATGSLTTTKANSWVWAIGDDWLASISRKVPAGQTLWHEAFDSVGDTYWVQATSAITKEAGTTVTINDPAPSKDPFDLILVEVL